VKRGDTVLLSRGYSAWFERTYPSLVNYLAAMPINSMWTVREVYAEDVTLASGPVVLLHVPRRYVVGSQHIESERGNRNERKSKDL
jgi:hypothetical protein